MLETYRRNIVPDGGPRPLRDMAFEEAEPIVPFWEYWVMRPLKWLFGK